MVHHINYSRGVAQFGSALGLGPWGRGFESLHLDQITVGIAQLVRAPDCGSGGREFESHYPPHQTDRPRPRSGRGLFQSGLCAASIGPSSSGKTQHFDCCIRRFESYWPSQSKPPQTACLAACGGLHAFMLILWISQ